jgi:membrane associated rhomboid family serine protease
VETGIVTNWSTPPVRFPWVTLAVILLCMAFKILHSAMMPMAQHAALELAGVLPSDLDALFQRGFGEWADYPLLTLFSALFVHASWVHLLGNMAYLWVFGMPLERRLGAFGMLLLFLLCGSLANLFVAMRLPELDTPIIGASGAVSAVIGAYLGLFPTRRIGMLLPLGLYLQFARVPAVIVIGSWFTLQLVYTVLGPINEVVAWWTHMAGLTLGLIFALMVRALAQINLR